MVSLSESVSLKELLPEVMEAGASAILTEGEKVDEAAS
jgi:hypothetical protein